MACLDYIEEVAFRSYVPSDEVAAIFVEPIQGDAGLHVPPDGWHQGLRRLCDRHGILLVVDEVQTGFGRTGKWLGMDHWGIKPDVTLLGKAMVHKLSKRAYVHCWQATRDALWLAVAT